MLGCPMTGTVDNATNPKDILGDTKPQLHLIPPAANLYEAIVMKLGADKYGPYNWREKKVRYTVYISAALRHLAAALDGEEMDPESGVPHIAHVRACMGILLDAKATGNLVDDRPVPGASGLLLKHPLRRLQMNTVNSSDIRCYSCGASVFDGEDHSRCRGSA